MLPWQLRSMCGTSQGAHIPHRRKAASLNTQDPRWSPPPQGYPPQPGQYPPADGSQQPHYGQQYGQGQYGQGQYGQGQYGGQYAPQPPQGQYAQPQQYMPYAQPGQPGQYAAVKQPAVNNPYATRALIYGVISLVLLIALFFTNYIFLGTFGLYAIYYAIRGLILSSRLPGHKGIVVAAIGLILSVLSVLGTIGVIILSAMLSASH